MPTGTVLSPLTQALPDSPAPKKTTGLSNVQPRQSSAPTHALELLFSAPMEHTHTPSIRLQPTTDHHYDTISAISQAEEAEDEYTLSAYGDISLSEIIVPPLPAPTHLSPMEPRNPQPCLRLKVRRPPMPKRRSSYAYMPDPLPYTGDLDPDDRWSGSPRPLVKSKPWLQHQPRVSALPVTPMTPRTQEKENKPAKNGGSSLEKLFDELVPPSPSIRLSPPGSPASQALGLPQETREQRNGVRQGQDARKAHDGAKSPQSSPTPAPKPKEAPWRTRLPPRLPIPKWDM